MAMPGQLFLYGVLQSALACGIVPALLAGLGPGRRAHVRGRLYAVRDAAGSYPAMIRDAMAGKVWGVLHDAGSVDLAALDRFEGVEYRRADVAVFSDGKETVAAQAYLWNRQVDGAMPAIPHGDFARYLAETGERLFAG